MGVRSGRKNARDLTERLDRDAAHFPQPLQKAVERGSFRIVFRFTGKRSGMPLKTKRRGSRHTAHATCKVREVTTLVQTPMLGYERSFSLKAGQFIPGVEVAVYPVDYLTTRSEHLSDDVALERVDLADGMVAASFSLMFQHSLVETLAHVERPTIWAAQQVDIIPA